MSSSIANSGKNRANKKRRAEASALLENQRDKLQIVKQVSQANRMTRVSNREKQSIRSEINT